MIYLLLLISGGCALFEPKSPQMSEHAHQVPSWAYAPMEACDQGKELCASGEALISSTAAENAMKSLTSIFEIHIQFEPDSLKLDSEQTKKSVSYEIDQMLKAAKIIKKYRSHKMSFALVSIEKKQVRTYLETAIAKSQSELVVLWMRKNRSSATRIWELLFVREALNDRLKLIDPNGIKGLPTAAEIKRWFQSNN